MHCDYLSVTMNEADCTTAVEDLTPILAQVGFASVFNGVYKLHTGGTLKTGATRGSAYHVSASGDFLRALRAEGLYGEYLMILGLLKVRVTRMDIAQDYSCDAPAELRKFRKKVESGVVSLTRYKLNLQTQYKSLLSQDRFGVESGSVYIGPKSVQTAGLMVYDKSKEQYDKFNRKMPPTLRWELKLGRKAGISLRDAYNPDPVFWHFMADLLPAPEGIPRWEPFDSELDLGPRVTLLPAESMRRLVESSELFPKLFALAEQVGPRGLDHLVRLILQRQSQQPINKQIPDESTDRIAS